MKFRLVLPPSSVSLLAENLRWTGTRTPDGKGELISHPDGYRLVLANGLVVVLPEKPAFDVTRPITVVLEQETPE